MWGWFTDKKSVTAEETADTCDVDVDVANDAVTPHITCSELVEVAATTPWEDWGTFILMTRNHNLDYMTRDQVMELFDKYKQCHTQNVAPEPCSPRQLAEFIYLLPPPRWRLFQQFAATVNIDSMSFPNLIIAFLMFETSHHATHTANLV